MINALQIAPRAGWTEIGRVLEIDPVTAARRWDRIHAEGLAWVTAYPQLPAWVRNHCLAFIDVTCEAGSHEQVIETLVHEPHVASVSQLGSGRDLLVLALFTERQALSRFVLDYLSQLPGVRSTLTHAATKFYFEGSRWRLRALSPSQQDDLSAVGATRSTGDETIPAPSRTLLRALSHDGRRTVAELAASTSTSRSTTRRRLSQIVQNGLITLRCEVADVTGGWPVNAFFWARVPATEIDLVARALSTLPEIRMCAALTGPENLILSVWLRSLSDSLRLEEKVAERFPAIQLTERAIVLRSNKRVGSLLDLKGRRAGIAPVDPWAPVPVGEAGITR